MKLGGGEIMVIKYTIFEDNNGALTAASSVNMTPHTKYIGMKYHFFKHHCDEGSATTLVKVATLLKKADIFIKGMVLGKLVRCIN